MPTSQEITSLLDASPTYVFSDRELAARFGLKSRAELYDMADVLEDLIDLGQIVYLDEKQGFQSVKAAKVAEGTLDYVSSRKAFVIVEEEESDIVVRPDELAGALHGDKVEVRYLPAYGDDKPHGKIVKVLERVRSRFVGTLQAKGRNLYLEPEMKRMYDQVAVETGQGVEAAVGDKVVVEVTDFSPGNLSGHVVENLGRSGTHKAEMLGILSEFGLPEAFEEHIEAEAAKIKAGITKTEVAKRRDFRGITTFTIDPIDAKDFDDALSIQKLENGHYEIGVHIADVTHYVKEGTALEAEALRRATSVYLVDRVVPMLPEKLSNELCSLRPHEDKLTFSAVFELDEQGQIYSQWFGRTAIHSDHRFAYEQVQEILDATGKAIGDTWELADATAHAGPFVEEVNTLNRIAYALRKQRFTHGAVSFESPELRFVLDEAGKPIKVVAKVRKDAHKLIEDFMLLANKYVAEFVFAMQPGEAAPKKTKAASKLPTPARLAGTELGAKNQQGHLPMVYRVHEPPDPDKIIQLSDFAKRFGHRLAMEKGNLPLALNALSQETESLPEGPVIAQFAIRSMQKAKYTTAPLGHFGLGYAHYSHFTSPIRRYPDMMAHRLLALYLAQPTPADQAMLEQACKHSTDMEKRAADAERASIKYKQVEFMAERIGQDFDGLVSGLTEWGLYVEISDTACEGMVRLADIRDDHYIYNPERMELVGRSRGRIFRFGDKVRIRVKDANLLKRTLDLVLADQGEPAQQQRHSFKGRSGEERSPATRDRERAKDHKRALKGKGRR